MGQHSVFKIASRLLAGDFVRTTKIVYDVTRQREARNENGLRKVHGQRRRTKLASPVRCGGKVAAGEMLGILASLWRAEGTPHVTAGLSSLGVAAN